MRHERGKAEKGCDTGICRDGSGMAQEALYGLGIEVEVSASIPCLQLKPINNN